MPNGMTCSLCNKPLSINGERVGDYYVISAERGTTGSECLRGKGSFKLRLCNECMESVLLTPADKADEEFKKHLYGECCDDEA